MLLERALRKVRTEDRSRFDDIKRPQVQGHLKAPTARLCMNDFRLFAYLHTIASSQHHHTLSSIFADSLLFCFSHLMTESHDVEQYN